MSTTETEVGHTPGPWTVTRDRGGYCIRPKGTGFLLAFADPSCLNPGGFGKRGEGARADAQLMATSPELLEYGETLADACERFMDNPYDEDALQDLKWSIADFRETAAKAKGEES